MEPVNVTLNLTRDGEPVGVIKDTLSNLHKFCLTVQEESFIEAKNKEEHDYIPDLASALSSKYEVDVTEDAAWQIAFHVFKQFELEKKSTDG